MTTPAHSTTGRRRLVLAPPSEPQSSSQPAQQPVARTAVAPLTAPAAPLPPPRLPDPPIYRELMRAWADEGRSLPGRHDPEWARLAAPWRGLGLFSPSAAAPRDGGR
ncbi:hypothetical protein [Streptomyces prasinus]|uniref:hypothetical protein n=1 Tax=Streptomyces prasinus TaxID=67345 RepID=UPI00200BFEE8|nr:hypothetical protein [Streptomyces prasinus]